ncbi:BQ2448_3713 [Microbotryum intermedium]|uniref:BQ2448_3713 protein n=1 Tax=Microbotryum intermedium TaxID=269621 RepID=A0A238FFP9_9BASI|nr:BQ2448_3713 [Microbotryum intermedium]
MADNLYEELESIYGRFGLSNDEYAARETLSQLQSLLPRLAKVISLGALPPGVMSACIDKVRQVNIVSHQLSCLESESAEVEEAAKLEASELLREPNSRFKNPPADREGDYSEDSTSQEEDHSILHYRSYFLEHISWPYPSPSDREQLLGAVPAHGRAQLSNWFVNSRRRSGWSALARTFGGGTKKGMEELIGRVEAGQGTEEEAESVDKVRRYFEDDGSLTIRPDLREMVERIERDMKTQTPSRKRKSIDEDDKWVDTPNRKRSWCGSSSSFSSLSEGSQSTLPSSPTFRSSSTLDSLGYIQIHSAESQPPPRCLSAHPSYAGSPAASFEYPNAPPASRRCVSDSRPFPSPKRSTPPYRSVSSSFALGIESTLAGSLTMPIDPDFLPTCQTAGSAWNGSGSSDNSDYRFASTSSSTLNADQSVQSSQNFTTTSNAWYETLQDDRWTELYPWLGSNGSDSLSGLDVLGQNDQELNWLMGTELAGLC